MSKEQCKPHSENFTPCPNQLACGIMHPIRMARQSIERIRSLLPLHPIEPVNLYNFLGGVLGHIDEAEELVVMISQGKSHEIQPRPRSIQTTLRNVMNDYPMIQNEIEFTGAMIERPVYVSLSEADIHAVMCHVILNSLESIAETNHEGFIYIRCFVEENHCTVEVHDNGVGLSSALSVEEMMLPYLSTKEVMPHQPQRGMGLHLCKQTITEHGGQMTLRPSPLGGAMFVMRLPVTQPAQASTSSALQAHT